MAAPMTVGATEANTEQLGQLSAVLTEVSARTAPCRAWRAG